MRVDGIDNGNALALFSFKVEEDFHANSNVNALYAQKRRVGLTALYYWIVRDVVEMQAGQSGDRDPDPPTIVPII